MFHLPARSSKSCVAALILSLPVSLFAASASGAVTIPGLGTATFATSTHSAEAQQHFMHGLLLLHLFEYQPAAQSFVAAEEADPAFAMAYWGEAMTFNHPVWNAVDVHAGQAALAKFAPTPEARAARISNPRERAYMAALEILYSGNGAKPERDAQYATAMQHLSSAYPTDDEARLFYALALLGRSEGVRDVPTYLRAAALAQAVFKRNPHHPGAAHYWIHGMDDPQHAAGALVAARALSVIAPDAAHAQHMCSHIFLALGMWDDVVRANVAATSVVNRQAAAAGKPARYCGHYNYWLEYGYIEQGRIADARQILTACETEASNAAAARGDRAAIDADSSSIGSAVVMRNVFNLDAAESDVSAAQGSVNLNGALMAQFRRDYATGLVNAASGDVAAAHNELSALGQLLPQLPALFDQEGVAAGDPSRSLPQIQELQLKAAILAAESHLDQAVETMEQAVASGKDLPYAFGPPDPEKPANEQLGELLLKSGKAAEARAALEVAIARTPNRTQTLLDLARAENAMGDKAAATKTAGLLLKIWRNADPAYAPRKEAEHIAAELPNPALH